MKSRRMKYGTRHLTAGEREDALVLSMDKKVRLMPKRTARKSRPQYKQVKR